MSDIIQNLLNDVLKDGARPSKYRCEVNLPRVFEADEKNLDVICKTATFPTKTNDVINIKFKGRDIPVPGQEKFSHSLDLTFYLDEKHKHKAIFEEWMQALNYEHYSANISEETDDLIFETQTDISTNIARTQIKLTQLNFEADLDTVAYIFYNVFPKEIGAVALGSESVSAISEFTVSFSFSHYEIEKKEDGTNANSIANDILGGIQDVANDIVDSAMGYLADTDIVKGLNSAASKGNTAIQDAGKSIGTSIDEFLG